LRSSSFVLSMIPRVKPEGMLFRIMLYAAARASPVA
jgi:hypothetical protein